MVHQTWLLYILVVVVRLRCSAQLHVRVYSLQSFVTAGTELVASEVIGRRVYARLTLSVEVVFPFLVEVGVVTRVLVVDASLMQAARVQKVNFTRWACPKIGLLLYTVFKGSVV
jgi:hypothetical protein